MRRRLFTLASAVSLLLCLATVGMWVRSWTHAPPPMPQRFFMVASGRFVDDGWYFGSGGKSIRVELDRGWMWVSRYPPDPFQQSAGSWWSFNFRVHLGYLLVAFAAFSGLCLFRVRRGIQVRGFCNRCSYNLTGNTSGVCPECGTACTTRAENNPGSTTER